MAAGKRKLSTRVNPQKLPRRRVSPDLHKSLWLVLGVVITLNAGLVSSLDWLRSQTPVPIGRQLETFMVGAGPQDTFFELKSTTSAPQKDQLFDIDIYVTTNGKPFITGLATVEWDASQFGFKKAAGQLDGQFLSSYVGEGRNRRILTHFAIPGTNEPMTTTAGHSVKFATITFLPLVANPTSVINLSLASEDQVLSYVGSAQPNSASQAGLSPERTQLRFGGAPAKMTPVDPIFGDGGPGLQTNTLAPMAPVFGRGGAAPVGTSQTSPDAPVARAQMPKLTTPVVVPPVAVPPGGQPVSLALTVMGVDSVGVSVSAHVVVRDTQSAQVAYDQMVSFTSQDQGVMLSNPIQLPSTPITGFDVIVKGPRHQQLKFVQVKPERGVLNLIGRPLPCGDLPIQDGKVNGLDLAALLMRMGSSRTDDLEVADCDQNGVINNHDRSLLLQTLIER